MTFKMNTMYKISTLSEIILFGDNYKFEMDGKYKKPFYYSSKTYNFTLVSVLEKDQIPRIFSAHFPFYPDYPLLSS